jgi:acyl-CoA synthetase (AMP-forming)/AMP-acid ligase II
MYPGAHAPNHPDKPAVIMAGSGHVTTYRELDERSNQLAQLWWKLGLRPGGHVAILAENTPRYYEVYWAAIRSGLYLTAINRFLSAEEAAYLVNDSGSTCLITTQLLTDAATEMLEMIPDCPHRFMIDGTAPGFESYESAVAEMPATPLASQPRGDVMLYSSGTTGRPKGIKRALSGLQIDDPGLMGISMLERHLLGMNEDTRYLSPAPLYHSAPLQWSTGIHELGGTIVVMEKFDAEGFLAAVEKHRITHTQVVPTMFVRMLKLPEEIRARYDTSTLENAVHAAAPCPVEVKRKMIDWWGPIICEYYAGTEGNGMTFIDSAQWLEHPGSVGKPMTGTPHICDDEGNELPVGESGLIYFERDAMPFEYHGDPEKTKSAQHPLHANWSALGDVGYLDDEGYLYLTDRKAFMIISGGVNIYPQEIEDALIVHEKVADAAVFGLPDLEMGEFVQAVVQPAEGVQGDEALETELRAYLREAIAHYKVPRVIDFRAELPRLPTGKLYKRLLRDEYQERMNEQS